MSHSLHPFEGVKSVLVVLSSRAMIFDQAALRNHIHHAYPGAAVFFVSVSGDPVGMKAPSRVDLVVDFTEPGARQPILFAHRMRSQGHFVVGRKAGFFYRNARYDRVYDASGDTLAPTDFIEGERFAQKKVLELAGIPVARQGGLTRDLSKEIGASLPVR
ncbi:MAG: hypothetical protein EBX52_07350 [Proteobacteria bacterium]|nr:hypothetical protein [Pseudomonadota bacterium]